MLLPMSYWSSGIGAEDRWHLSIDTVRFSGWISLRLGELCMISTKVLCAATSELGNSSSYSVCAVYPLLQCQSSSSSLVRASDRNSEDPGSNPGWISMSFFTIMQLCTYKHLSRYKDDKKGIYTKPCPSLHHAYHVCIFLGT